jgi:hypothetical protein
MGFGIMTRPKITYFNPLFGEGFFVTKSEEGAPGAVLRTNKRNVPVWEARANWLSGHLIEVVKAEDQYGLFFKVRLHQDGESVVFSLPFDAPQTRTFLNCLSSAPANALKGVFTVRVARVRRKKDQKETTYLNLHLADETSFERETSLGFHYAASDLPEPTEVTVAGKARLDFTDLTNFLWSAVERDVIPRLPRISELTPSETAAAHALPSDDVEPIPDERLADFPLHDDDIPF